MYDEKKLKGLLDVEMWGGSHFPNFSENLKPYVDLGKYLDVYSGSNSSRASALHNPNNIDCIIDTLKEHLKLNDVDSILYNRLDEELCPASTICLEKISDAIAEDFPDIPQYCIAGSWGANKRQPTVTNCKVIGTQWFYWSCGFNVDKEFSEFKYSVTNKTKDFVCLNRVQRVSRMYFVSLLSEHGLLDKGHVSLSFSTLKEHNVYSDEEGFKNINPDFINDHLNEHLYKTGISKNDLIVDDKDFYIKNPANVLLEHRAPYEDSWFTVINETYGMFEPNHVEYLSEKCLKPIINKHPFIVNGSGQLIKTLQEVGLKTFHPYIDESYDNITDPEEKFQAIIKEINRLCNLSEEEKLEFYENVNPILEYNFDMITNRKLNYVNW